MKKLAVVFVATMSAAGLSCSINTNKEPSEDPASNVEKVLTTIENEFGAFDEVDYEPQDSSKSWHIYYGNDELYDRTRLVKNIIDKTMNMVGKEIEDKSPFSSAYGSYVWETPSEKITLRGARKRDDSTSFLTVGTEQK